MEGGKKITNVAHIYGLNCFTVGKILKDKASHAICGKCGSYVIENNQQEMKKNDGQNRKKKTFFKAWLEDQHRCHACSLMLS